MSLKPLLFSLIFIIDTLGIISKALANTMNVNSKACTKLFSYHGPVGCGSHNIRDDGLLYEISNDLQFNDFINYCNTKYTAKDMMILVESSILKNENKSETLYTHSKVRGIIVYDENNEFEGSKESSPYYTNSSIVWSQYSNELLNRNIDKPLFWVYVEDAVSIRKYDDIFLSFSLVNRPFAIFRMCQANLNQKFSFNYAQMYSYAGKHSKVTSKKCLEWRNIFGQRSV